MSLAIYISQTVGLLAMLGFAIAESKNRRVKWLLWSMTSSALLAFVATWLEIFVLDNHSVRIHIHLLVICALFTLIASRAIKQQFRLGSTYGLLPSEAEYSTMMETALANELEDAINDNTTDPKWEGEE